MRIERMVSKLEEIKQLGYALDMRYGEGAGCDDGNVPALERRIQVKYVPVGCLGSGMVLWLGTLKEFLEFDFTSRPQQTYNPPPKDILKKKGYFAWGTDYLANVYKIRKWGRFYKKYLSPAPE